jgi:hypothetical protein
MVSSLFFIFVIKYANTKNTHQGCLLSKLHPEMLVCCQQYVGQEGNDQRIEEMIILSMCHVSRKCANSKREQPKNREVFDLWFPKTRNQAGNPKHFRPAYYIIP